MKKYYSIERIKKIDAQFKILLGGRNIGKSYAVKHDVVRECYKNGREFIYLRRWDEDIQTKYVTQYFGDLDIKGITDGAYSDIYMWQGKIYLCNYDELYHVKEKFLIGYAHSLNQNERYKSQIFPLVDYIVYEEFITDKLYLPNETATLQEYTSTIFRERVGVVYMVGNTISKLCPYFNEWRLDKVNNMKTHDINLFENTTEVIVNDEYTEIVVKVAVEMCGAQNVLSKMAFGDSASMIVKNTWRTKTCPILDNDVYDKSDILHTVYVQADNLMFKMELLCYNNNIFWYVKPHTRQIRNIENVRLISQNASMYPKHTVSFAPLSDRERIAFDLILQKKIFYCSNSCGSDFEQTLKKYRMVKNLQ